MDALITPANVATKKPRTKLNSLMASCFCSADNSRSLDIPAMPLIAIPTRQTATPTRRPGWVLHSFYQTKWLSIRRNPLFLLPFPDVEDVPRARLRRELAGPLLTGGSEADTELVVLELVDAQQGHVLEWPLGVLDINHL